MKNMNLSDAKRDFKSSLSAFSKLLGELIAKRKIRAQIERPRNGDTEPLPQPTNPPVNNLRKKKKPNPKSHS